MKYIAKQDAFLLLEDGSLFKGQAVGKIGTTGGELCFNTGMTGYQEIYTDPSYTGQLIVQTVAHIGNYGVHVTETESSSVKFAGLVCGTFADVYSRTVSEGSLQQYLEKAGIVGISGLDTRQIVRHIRSKGAMNAVISSEMSDQEQLQAYLRSVPSMSNLELSSQVSTPHAYTVGSETASWRVAVLDLGVKESIIKNLVARGVQCRVFPAKTTFEQMQAWQPDGYFISNGPGDPAAMDYAVETVQAILASGKPLFGICLGHQILARACGISTYKMHHGHRGLNHPVKNLRTGRTEITSQNHGFAVNKADLLANAEVELTHLNLNDDTVEGLALLHKPAFSVQYHPESSPGPHDSTYLFDDFVALIANNAVLA
ncbi:carbamoyl-phosphate synthase small subunit [Flexibacter flexilis DSM 6793]|uniref:Carbamoyl phosphate synthase small chain n=1 Tax=Flexibacter flexilis DSM 6793 TaxID=927664 RepID=A0A1I1LU61_9BACT|nr:glutamine-hydrolyzing carbamoyl-phosphate synthase small subunit [Flexibacter flexilis]SFC76535.1 carbamoyl-phosphate synthase small subunit [Flexibacter flexilis DSM 6793]